MNNINEVLKKYSIKPIKYQKKGNTLLLETKENKYVYKENSNNIDIYSYLNSRSFNYYPKVITDKLDSFEITKYEEEINMPKEQKILDMISLVSLLHFKTSYFKEIDNNEYLTLYEDLNNNIAYLYSYYSDLISLIESKIFMAPSEYLLARNISKVLIRLDILSEEINIWFNLVKNKEKVRQVILHNNLELSHYIKNTNEFLISWNKSKIGMPIFDLYKFYIRNTEVDLIDILDIYERNYPLLIEEKELLFILVKMPSIIVLDKDEYTNTINVRKFIDYIDKTEKLILPNSHDYRPN